ncbi:MAG: hypothetical protein Q4G23_10120 [Clostridia bacterium]|nr:hypothetical protein [Clostridia bacterium]
MNKRILTVSLLIIIVLSLFTFTGCENSNSPLLGDVTIIGPDGEKLLDSEIYVTKNNATAADAVIMACSEMKFAYTYENGMFDNFDGLASTMEDGWLFYTDYELSETGAGEYLLEDGFIIEFRYVNYDESFNLE